MEIIVKTWSQMTHQEQQSILELYRQADEEALTVGPLGNSIKAIGVSDFVVKKWVAELNQPHRYYHTLKHVENILANYEHITGDSREIMAAAWLHDIVYDPKRQDNEELSAAQAGVDLIGTDLDIPLVQDIILDTKYHQGGNLHFDVFNDLDLSVLSIRTSRGIYPWYYKYAQQIRQEYSFVPLLTYVKKRIEILESFDQKRIYKTDIFSHQEEKAHANIRDEIDGLRSDPELFLKYKVK